MKVIEYFASSVYGWATDSTLQGAIDKLIAHTNVSNADIRVRQKEGKPGLPVFTNQIEYDEDKGYKISFYRPEDDETTTVLKSGYCFVTYINKKKAMVWEVK